MNGQVKQTCFEKYGFDPAASMLHEGNYFLNLYNVKLPKNTNLSDICGLNTLFCFRQIGAQFNAKSYGSRHGISIYAKKGRVRYIMTLICNLYTSFQSHKWPQTKMYTISDTVFWHSFSCSFTWCDPFSYLRHHFLTG